MSTSSSTPWTQMLGGAKYYSCEPLGCWAVNNQEQIFFMNVSLSLIEVTTDGSVFRVNKAGQILNRRGVTANQLEGTSWTIIS
ncbi:unnamed protein product, partial [Coregonus sp. 'balchen']